MKSIYSAYTPDQVENLLSNYIIDSWSYSKVSAFRQNEARFQMQYIYLAPMQRSINSIAGNAYHEALKLFFLGYNAGAKTPNRDELVTVANNYIDDIEPSVIELTTKITTADDAVAECRKIAEQLISFFCDEYNTYTENIAEVLQVEEKAKAWVVVNGVSIPLPLHFIVDLVIRTKDGKTVVVDHKSKRSFTDEDEAVDAYCDQSMTYVLGLEATTNLHIDEAWFIETKASRNKDKSAQIKKHTIVMDDEMRSQCEAELYQPLKRMINALSDPDYYYMYNPGDMLIDHKAMKEFRREKQLDTKHPVLAPQVVDYIERRNKRAAALADAGQKIVFQYTIDGTLVRAWSSVREAEHDLGYSRAQIQRVCNGKRKTCGGYIWTYNKIA